MSIREIKSETNESSRNIDIGTVLIRDGSGECTVFGYGHTEYFKDYIDAAQAANSARKEKIVKKSENIMHAEGSAKGGKPAIAISQSRKFSENTAKVSQRGIQVMRNSDLACPTSEAHADAASGNNA